MGSMPERGITRNVFQGWGLSNPVPKLDYEVSSAGITSLDFSFLGCISKIRDVNVTLTLSITVPGSEK